MASVGVSENLSLPPNSSRSNESKKSNLSKIDQSTTNIDTSVGVLDHTKTNQEGELTELQKMNAKYSKMNLGSKLKGGSIRRLSRRLGKI